MDFCLPGRTFGVLQCLGGQKKLLGYGLPGEGWYPDLQYGWKYFSW